MTDRITIVGGGFAGVEAAWAAATRGSKVTLYEMRPKRMTSVHRTGDLAELVCRCLNGRVSPAASPIAAAHPQAWQLREILARIAQALGRRISFVPVPWRLVWATSCNRRLGRS